MHSDDEDLITPVDPVAALSHIKDDDADIREAQRWAAEAMIDGERADDLISELTTEGWDAGNAEEIVEHARLQTRRERGVITREDVVRDLNARHRQATAGLSVAFRSGLFGVYGWTTSVLAAIRAIRRLKRLKAITREGSGRDE